MFRRSMAQSAYLKFGGRLLFAALVALTFCMVHPSSTAYARKRRPANYGVIQIRTRPAGYLVEIDGRSEGQTSSDYSDHRVDPGLHTVIITLPGGQRWTREINVPAGRIKCIELAYRPSVPPPPHTFCPYPVSLTAAAQVNEGEEITFTSDVSYSGAARLNYTWTVSPGNAKIIGAMGEPTLKVNSNGLAGQHVTATLVVDDGSGDPNCRQVAQASTFIPPPPPPPPTTQFDVCCSCSFDDQKARLDNLAVNLQNDPSATTYIIAYGGRTSRAGQADALGARARAYLIKNRGLDQSRIVVMNGGYREEDCVELWIIPSGAAPPQPTPTIQQGDVRPVRRSRRRD
jgi:hypothetical protein